MIIYSMTVKLSVSDLLDIVKLHQAAEVYREIFLFLELPGKLISSINFLLNFIN